MQAIIMAGGKGVRLQPYTSIIPKPLLPVGEMPIIEILVKQLSFLGFTKVSIATGYLGELIQSYLGKGEKYGIEIEYSFEKRPLGTVAPLKLIPNLKENVLVMNADILTDLNYKTLMNFHIEENAAITLSVYKKRERIDYGVIDTDENSRLTAFREKPYSEVNINMGIYIINRQVLDYLPENQQVDFPDLINHLISKNKKVLGYDFKGYWQDIGQHLDYERVQEEFQKIRGGLHIDEVGTYAV